MQVLLVHGLGRTPMSCLGLGRALRRADCAVESFSYVAFAEAYAGIVTRLVGRLERIAAQGEYSVIGHSLGGILLRDALARVTGSPRHFVMLGTPNHPPRAARIAAGFPPFRWVSGECGARLSDEGFYRALPRPSVPCTIIAGTRGPVGRWSPFGLERNDGLVAVSETQLSEDIPVLTFPVAHTFMMSDPAVQAAVRRALCAGGE